LGGALFAGSNSGLRPKSGRTPDDEDEMIIQNAEAYRRETHLGGSNT
jgi:hypothetical protein